MTTSDSAHCALTLQALRHDSLVVSGKWKLQLIVALLAGTRHFRGLERSVPGISTKVLAKELKDLEVHQLIARTVYPASPWWWSTPPCPTRTSRRCRSLYIAC
ncbi:DNA-binding HxlR family transcriptional regulator [Hymenobacter sp. UYAg731]